ncbi:DUF2061 domain-containing protein [Pseudohalocynthiibacter aestuariivivens]|jgi:uncharacterized membrane protein|uniref:DUF2061 domain-containing protein n=1 Tax=Pseudohalocynthiibacter aestuariivivens TaxID=1591409 RepID=A0ABV5JEK1_9RHOB|nr:MULTISPECIES: DUF2061 domain-containing protein [Pseudohalocynthiibacter]MBS9716994.1 DUF2061 domain-containing protein [Pseudohalocynthiibacter aestuariivivens]MCK0101907.1 DUF2061 domain-containing protein [Pseudohalocynthiibacter sp. F2068]
MDTKRRTWVKAIGWQGMGLATMALIGFLITGSFSIGSLLALINATVGFLSYLAYERLWNRISWGRATLVQRERNG